MEKERQIQRANHRQRRRKPLSVHQNPVAQGANGRWRTKNNGGKNSHHRTKLRGGVNGNYPIKHCNCCWSSAVRPDPDVVLSVADPKSSILDYLALPVRVAAFLFCLPLLNRICLAGSVGLDVYETND